MCKFITITSLLTGNGAKFVGTNLAHTLKANNKDSKVALIDFDFDSPFLAKELLKGNMGSFSKGIDNIYAKLHSGTLSQELFLDNMIEINGVDILQGTSKIGSGKIYSHKDVEEVLDIIKKEYDYAVIVTGNNFTYASTILSLFRSHELFLVIRENISNEVAFSQQIETIKSYLNDDKKISVIYNYVTSNIHVEELGNYIKDSNFSVIGQLEFESGSIDNVDLIGKRKIFSGKNKNAETFNSICKNL